MPDREQNAQPAAESAQAGDPLDVELFPEHRPLAHGRCFSAPARFGERHAHRQAARAQPPDGQGDARQSRSMSRMPR